VLVEDIEDQKKLVEERVSIIEFSGIDEQEETAIVSPTEYFK
jgi:hypothetical protein